MKQISVVIILFAFLLQSFNQASIVASYYANTAAYAKNCINKAKPQMHCNGKCQMMRKLKQESQKDQQNPERSGSLKKETISSKSFFVSLSGVKQAKLCIYNLFLLNFPPEPSFSFFHPPGILIA